jgi:hypothetical protein
MNALARTLIATMLLPLLAIAGVLLLVAARYIGGATPLPALLAGTGLMLYVAVTVAGATFFGDATAPEMA